MRRKAGEEEYFSNFGSLKITETYVFLSIVRGSGFSALQRAEIAEIAGRSIPANSRSARFSALQRAEIAEIVPAHLDREHNRSFSALQRAEIAEMIDLFCGAGGSSLFQCSSTSRNC